ncbi:hypothetical protein [Abyssisolibacter fermentans]|nr:hypothetical protein [Abyssisolibacter fermentans]
MINKKEDGLIDFNRNNIIIEKLDGLVDCFLFKLQLFCYSYIIIG